jgi:hypothetical protein
MGFISGGQVTGKHSHLRISIAQFIVSVLQQSVSRFVVKFFGGMFTRSRVQVPRGSLLETSNISVGRRGQVERMRCTCPSTSELSYLI